MKVFSLIEGVMMKLSLIPGLRFLQTYVTEFHGRQTQIGQTIGDYQGYVRAARDAGSDVNQAVRGPKKDEDSDDEFEEEYDDDDESYLQ